MKILYRAQNKADNQNLKNVVLCSVSQLRKVALFCAVKNQGFRENFCKEILWTREFKFGDSLGLEDSK